MKIVQKTNSLAWPSTRGLFGHTGMGNRLALVKKLINTGLEDFLCGTNGITITAFGPLKHTCKCIPDKLRKKHSYHLCTVELRLKRESLVNSLCVTQNYSIELKSCSSNFKTRLVKTVKKYIMTLTKLYFVTTKIYSICFFSGWLKNKYGTCLVRETSKLEE